MTRNEQITIIKTAIVFAYTLFAIFLMSQFPTGSIFFTISHFLLINVSIAIWFIMVFVFATNYIERRIIEMKLERAEKSVGEIANTMLFKYKRHTTHVTMKFRSCGVCVEDWENKKARIQAAINYRILSIEHDEKDFGIIIVNAIKGCSQINTGVLYDDEF